MRRFQRFRGHSRSLLTPDPPRFLRGPGSTERGAARCGVAAGRGRAFLGILDDADPISGVEPAGKLLAQQIVLLKRGLSVLGSDQRAKRRKGEKVRAIEERGKRRCPEMRLGHPLSCNHLLQCSETLYVCFTPRLQGLEQVTGATSGEQPRLRTHCPCNS